MNRYLTCAIGGAAAMSINFAKEQSIGIGTKVAETAPPLFETRVEAHAFRRIRLAQAARLTNG
ncbi:MAG: hypothetical protein Q7K57_57985 [Burkholderiaceae bacterium]|nr:hypothetical protein [Burkholderiaceae bacterium]